MVSLFQIQIKTNTYDAYPHTQEVVDPRPQDILARVMSFLSTEEVQQRARYVCREWRACSYRDDLWSFLCRCETQDIETPTNTDEKVHNKKTIYVELRKHFSRSLMKERMFCLQIQNRLIVFVGEEHGVPQFRNCSTAFIKDATLCKNAYFHEGCSRNRAVELNFLQNANTYGLTTLPFTGVLDPGYFYGIEKKGRHAICSFLYFAIAFYNKDHDYKHSIFRTLIKRQDYQHILEKSIVEGSTNREFNTELLKEVKRANLHFSQSDNLEKIPLNLCEENDTSQNWYFFCCYFVRQLLIGYEISPESANKILAVIENPDWPEQHYRYVMDDVFIYWRNEAAEEVLEETMGFEFPDHIISITSLGANHLQTLISSLINKKTAKLDSLLGGPEELANLPNLIRKLIAERKKDESNSVG